MRSYELYNLSRDALLLSDVQVASSFFKRLKGLMGTKELNDNQGLVIRPCNSVHTFGMKINIDIAFVDKNNKVIRIIEDMRRKKVSPIVKGSKYVIEAKAGKFKNSLAPGDEIKIIGN